MSGGDLREPMLAHRLDRRFFLERPMTLGWMDSRAKSRKQ